MANLSPQLEKSRCQGLRLSSFLAYGLFDPTVITEAESKIRGKNHLNRERNLDPLPNTSGPTVAHTVPSPPFSPNSPVTATSPFMAEVPEAAEVPEVAPPGENSILWVDD